MTTFAVSKVERAAVALETVDARAAIESLVGGPVEACWRSARPLARAWTWRPTQTEMNATGAFHPFVAAVHAAFDQHRPLIVSPDAVWLAIAQGSPHTCS